MLYPADELDHALATGKNHVRQGKKIYLLTRELKKKTSMLQSRISGNPKAPLLAQGAVIKLRTFQAPSIEDFLIEADPRFRPPSQWKKRSQALRDLSTLPLPSWKIR